LLLRFGYDHSEMPTVGILLFILVCLFGAAFGGLQCFDPARLRRLQKRYRPKADYSDSAGGKLLETYLDRQARQPTLMYRLSGFVMAILFLYLLLQGVHRLSH
jgi:hypothetical protein